MKKGYKVALLILLVLLIDQSLKFYIKTHFEYNEDYALFGLDWARLHFVENEGMAFGITFDWAYGKLLLSLFRILMVAGLIWYIRLLMQAGASMGFTYSVGLITAGALGNIIDSAFYGLIFTESFHGGPAELVPFGQGYGTFLHGKVVDMLYFPMKYVELPEWLGGGNFLFFSPIFNIADAAITVGVLIILIFQRRFFAIEPKEPEIVVETDSHSDPRQEQEIPESISGESQIAQADDLPQENAGTPQPEEENKDKNM